MTALQVASSKPYRHVWPFLPGPDGGALELEPGEPAIYPDASVLGVDGEELSDAGLTVVDDEYVAAWHAALSDTEAPDPESESVQPDPNAGAAVDPGAEAEPPAADASTEATPEGSAQPDPNAGATFAGEVTDT